jgi:RNA polymerase sigma factor (sigma-70 family)
MSDTDLELLARFTRKNADEAFTEIVRRYINLVYSAALRQVCSHQLAEEVTQSAFIKLARNAHNLSPDILLPAWLYTITHHAAIDMVRREARRQLREQFAIESNFMNAVTPDWLQVEPLLDEAMHALDETDRTAVLLRYFENKSLREVGQSLGTSEDAAQKRVSRAVERLREFFSKRGIPIGASSLVAVLSANAVQAAPTGLTVTISTAAALAATAIQTSTAIVTTKAIAMTTIQKTLITTTIAAAVGTGIYEAQRAAYFQEQAQTHQHAQDSLTKENQQLRQERDDAATKLATAKWQAGQPSGDMAELMRLRAEVTRLRENSRELAQLKAAASSSGNDAAIEATLKSWAARAAQLKQRLEQMPEKKIPEVQLLAEKDWFDAIKNVKQLETDDDFRQAFSSLRNSAKSEFGDQIRKALKSYASSNNGSLPQDLSQLKDHFETPVSDAILQRYSLLQTGKLADVPRDEFLVAETASPVDDEYDSSFQFRMSGTRSTGVSKSGTAIEQAIVQFAEGNNGVLATEPSQLVPYFTEPVDPAKVRKFMGNIPPSLTTLEQLKAAGFNVRK